MSPELHVDSLQSESLDGTSGQEPACQSRATEEKQVPSPIWKIPLQFATAIHSSILAWKIPWAEDPGGLQCLGPRRVGCD